MEDKPTEARAIADLAAAGLEVSQAETHAAPFVVVPSGYRIENLEQHLQRPIRKRGIVAVRDAASFIELVKMHANDSTVLYRTTEPPKFVAVFNDHQPGDSGDAGWGDHQASYHCPLSPEWVAWQAANKRQMSQADFAQFIEDNLPDIVEPSGADMLEVSRTLQAKKKVNFASGIRLDNGQTQFTYEEQIDGKAGGRGHLKVPEVFKIGVPVFEGGPRYAVNARLRYRISDAGALTLWFDLERPHTIVQHAVDEIDATVREATGFVTINGGRG